MKCVILAAGKGTRMLPLTEHAPKALIEYQGKALIEHVLEEFAGAGFKKAGIVVGYFGEQIMEKLGSEFKGMKLEYLKQKEQKGTGDAVQSAREWVRETEFVCGSTDVIVGKKDLGLLAKEMRDCEAIVLGRESKEPWRYGCLKIEENKLVEIVEKPEKGEAPGKLVNAGAYKFSKEIFESIEKTKESERGELEITNAINLLARQGKACFVKATETVKDIGSLEDLKK